MHGHGLLIYNTQLKGVSDHSYEGQFHLNTRVGQGILTKKNGDVYSGNFENNWPNGHTVLSYANGDRYEGEVIRGDVTGHGLLQCTNMMSYRGQFLNGRLHGEGITYVEGSTYSLSGHYDAGVPEKTACKYKVDIISPKEEEEDPKAKKDPKKAAAAPVGESTDRGNAMKVEIDVCNPNEEQKKLTIKITVLY